MRDCKAIRKQLIVYSSVQEQHIELSIRNEPRCEKTGLRGFRPGPTQTRLYSHRRWLEAGNFEFRKKRDYTIRVAKTKALISFAVTAKLICVFVFAYAKNRFSHNEAQMQSHMGQTEALISSDRILFAVFQ